MGVQITGSYLGGKKVKLRHGPSGAELITAAPIDNQGDGSSFSPTDLVASGLAACMLTLIAIVADRSNIDISGTHVEIEKNMISDPRRIGSLPATIYLPQRLSPEERTKLENAALTCPVHKSIRSEIDAPVTFVYDV